MNNIPDQNNVAIKFDVLYAQVEAHCQCDGLSQADILTMPVPLATLLNHLVRQDGLTIAQIAADFNLTEAESAQIIGMLLQKGLVMAEWNSAPDLPMHKYKAHLAPKRQRKAQTAIWKALDL